MKQRSKTPQTTRIVNFTLPSSSSQNNTCTRNKPKPLSVNNFSKDNNNSKTTAMANNRKSPTSNQANNSASSSLRQQHRRHHDDYNDYEEEEDPNSFNFNPVSLSNNHGISSTSAQMHSSNSNNNNLHEPKFTPSVMNLFTSFQDTPILFSGYAEKWLPPQQRSKKSSSSSFSTSPGGSSARNSNYQSRSQPCHVLSKGTQVVFAIGQKGIYLLPRERIALADVAELVIHEKCGSSAITRSGGPVFEIRMISNNNDDHKYDEEQSLLQNQKQNQQQQQKKTTVQENGIAPVVHSRFLTFAGEYLAARVASVLRIVAPDLPLNVHVSQWPVMASSSSLLGSLTAENEDENQNGPQSSNRSSPKTGGRGRVPMATGAQHDDEMWGMVTETQNVLSKSPSKSYLQEQRRAKSPLSSSRFEYGRYNNSNNYVSTANSSNRTSAATTPVTSHLSTMMNRHDHGKNVVDDVDIDDAEDQNNKSPEDHRREAAQRWNQLRRNARNAINKNKKNTQNEHEQNRRNDDDDNNNNNDPWAEFLSSRNSIRRRIQNNNENDDYQQQQYHHHPRPGHLVDVYAGQLSDDLMKMQGEIDDFLTKFGTVHEAGKFVQRL